MIDIAGRTIGAVFAEAAASHGSADFLLAPPRSGGTRLSYADTAARVAAWSHSLAAAGYGAGQRVAVQLGNRPEHLALKLALNAIGLSIVPINPEYRPAETAYLLTDSAACLAIADPDHADALRAGIAASGQAVPCILLDDLETGLPPAPEAAHPPLTPESEASLLYTSGTTGRPKGCILSHEYELMIGQRYLSCGGAMAFGPAPRILNPLPLYHLNAACVSFMGALLSGGCQIQPPRFSRQHWWQDVRDTDAQVLHCLGIVAPAILSLPEAPDDAKNPATLAVSAGIDPSLHRRFE
ncbi:MAG: AMP-binding protein, partial [Pseudomonadota bacterium]